jgi:hypothetical protein
MALLYVSLSRSQNFFQPLSSLHDSRLVFHFKLATSGVVASMNI